MKVRWTRLAVDDLAAIRRHISRDRPVAAQGLATRIREAVGRLSEQPGIGRAGRVPDTRELVVIGTPFVVPYRVKDEEVQILRVLHGAREWPDAL